MRNATDTLTSTARASAPWLAPLARMGYVAAGVLHLAIGVLALRLAMHKPTDKPDATGAFAWLSDGPLGTVLLGVAAAGLFGFAAWRLAAAIAGRGAPLGTRLGAAASGLGHAGLGLAAVRRLVGRPGPGAEAEAASWSARVMAWPAGEWLLAGVGAAIVGAGLWQLYRAIRGDAMKGVDTRPLDAGARAALARVGAAGLAARGVALALLGAFLGEAALRHDPAQAQGLGGALRELLGRPEGPALVALMALGFMAYGAFMVAKAAQPRLDPLQGG